MINYDALEREPEERQSDRRQRIASLTSNILNPFLVSLAVILLFSFSSTPTTLEAVKWSLITVAVSVAPVFLFVLYLIRSGGIDDIFASVREQRTKIYLISGASILAGYFLLSSLQAPTVLVTGFSAVLLMAVVFMFINLRWKISVHTGCVAASSLVLVMLYGWSAAVTIPLVPLTAWARVELEHHSLAQTVTGAVLAAGIAAVIFYPLTIV